ncbi:uncharacterized protein LOC141592359 isoform X2 [Silene latifolia]|uniref:uncharacterized protein LOC141592359 isoform X2 n=1 Tax=Silene latifolia TaxID=37657 RepID=UPI003D786CDA
MDFYSKSGLSSCPAMALYCQSSFRPFSIVLWKGNYLYYIYRPRKEGGFNIKELLSWDKALLAKWLWMLDHNSAGYLAQWNRAYTFHDSSIWQLSIKDRYPESLCSIIKVKNEIPARTGSISASITAVTSWYKNGKLPTVDLLISRGMVLINKCTLCKQMAETHRHLFFTCMYSQQVWQGLVHWMALPTRSNDLETELKWMVQSRGRHHWKHNWKRSYLAAAIFYMWQKRNGQIFNGKETKPAALIEQIKTVVKIRLLACQSHRSCIELES